MTKASQKCAAVAVLSALLISSLAGCGGSKSGKPGESGMMGGPESGMPAAGGSGQSSSITVDVTYATTGTLDRSTEFAGKLEASNSVNVYAGSAAQVTKTYVSAGETVHKGDLLFEIDTKDLENNLELAYLKYQSAVNSADSSVRNAENNWDTSTNTYMTAKHNLEDLEDNYDDQLDDLKEDRNNKKDLYDDAQTAYDAEVKASGSASQATADALDSAKTAYETAKSAYESYLDEYDSKASSYETTMDNARLGMEYAKYNYDTVNGDDGTAQNQVQQAMISYQQALDSLDGAQVRAPIAGVVSAKNISDSDMVGTNTAAYTITGSGIPVVSFNVSEAGANALSVGDDVTIVYNSKEYKAKVIELSLDADPSTGLYAVKAQPESDLGTTRTGAVVKVVASTAHEDNALILPLSVVEYDDDQPYVYVYENGVARRKDLVTGMSTSDSIQVVSGITAEDAVITTWHPDLKDGAAVYNETLGGGSSQAAQPSGAMTDESGQPAGAPQGAAIPMSGEGDKSGAPDKGE